MQASRLVLVVLIPATLLMMVACMPLTRLAYGPGDVSTADVRVGGAFLAAYVVGLTAVGLTQVLQKGIYASGDFVTPLKVEVLTLGLYIAAAVGLSQVWSIVGLAVARAGHFTITVLLTFWMVRHVPEVPSLRRLAACAFRPFLAGIVMVAFYAVAFLSMDLAHPSASYILTAGEQCVLLLASGCVYLVAGAALGIPEIAVLRQLLPLPRLWGLAGRPLSSYSPVASGGVEGED